MREQRENNFDFLRLFAAFCVMVWHAVVHLNIPFLWVKQGVFWFNDGVALFFILSGMLVYASYEKCFNDGKSVRLFYTNRFLRIAPAIYAYTIITTILLLLFGAISIRTLANSQFIKWVFSNLILVPVYYPSIFSHIGVGVIDGALGTIPMEFSFYLIVPVIFMIERRFGFKKTITILFTIGILGSTITWIGDRNIIEPLWLKFFKITFMSRFIFFAMGIFWLRMWKYVSKSKYLFILSIIAYFLGSWVLHGGRYLGGFWDFVRGIPLSYATIWFGYCGPKVFNRFTTKIGDLSYGVYIWHMVIVNLFLFLKIPTKFNYLPSTLIHLTIYTITFIFAILSWRLIEKPALKLKKYSSRSLTKDSKVKEIAI